MVGMPWPRRRLWSARRSRRRPNSKAPPPASPLLRKTLHPDVGALHRLMPRPVVGEPLRKSVPAFAVQIDEEISLAADGGECIEDHDPLDHNRLPPADSRTDDAPPLGHFP